MKRVCEWYVPLRRAATENTRRMSLVKRLDDLAILRGKDWLPAGLWHICICAISNRCQRIEQALRHSSMRHVVSSSRCPRLLETQSKMPCLKTAKVLRCWEGGVVVVVVCADTRNPKGGTTLALPISQRQIMGNKVLPHGL